MSETGINPDGTARKRLDQLPRVSRLTMPTQPGGPAGMESGDGCPRGGWATATEGESLVDQSRMAGYPTPAEDNANNAAGHKTEGVGSYVLNHRFSLWLQGYPDEWASCGERAMQSSRR